MSYYHKPETCDLCSKPIETDWTDSRTVNGPWAWLCLDCHKTHGIGFGLGLGQRYRDGENGPELMVGTTPEAIRTTVRFAHTIMQEAEGSDMTTGQLITALMSTLTVLIKDCGDKTDQDEMCHRLLEGLRNSLDLTVTGTTLH